MPIQRVFWKAKLHSIIMSLSLEKLISWVGRRQQLRSQTIVWSHLSWQAFALMKQNAVRACREGAALSPPTNVLGNSCSFPSGSNTQAQCSLLLNNKPNHLMIQETPGIPSWSLSGYSVLFRIPLEPRTWEKWGNEAETWKQFVWIIPPLKTQAFTFYWSLRAHDTL